MSKEPPDRNANALPKLVSEMAVKAEAHGSQLSSYGLGWGILTCFVPGSRLSMPSTP